MSNDGTGSTLPTTQPPPPPPPPPPPRPPVGAARAQCRHAHGDKIKCSTARGGWAGLLVLHAAGWRPPLPLRARAWRGWWCWPSWPGHWLSRLNQCSSPRRVSVAGVGLPKRPLTPAVAIGRAMRPSPSLLLNWRSSQCRRPLPLTSRPRRPGPVYRPVVPPALRQGLASKAPTAKPTKPSGAKEPLPYPAATTTAAGGGGARAPPYHR